MKSVPHGPIHFNFQIGALFGKVWEILGIGACLEEVTVIMDPVFFYLSLPAHSPPSDRDYSVPDAPASSTTPL